MQSRVKLLGSTALAVAALFMGAPTASADSSLEKRVTALEKAGGQSVTRSKKTVKLTVNGHMYRATQYRNNGTESGFVHITPNVSRTRVRWIASGKVNDDLSLQSVIELGASSGVGNVQALAVAGANPALDERLVELRVKSKSLGTLYMGQGYTAQSSQYGADLSGTGVFSLNGQSARLTVGGENFQSGGAAIGRTVISAFNVFDTARTDRIRYDTPKFSGFQFRADHQSSDDWGVSANYGASIGGVKIAARIGHNNMTQSSATSATRTNGSISVLLPFGLSLTGGYGALDDDGAPGTTTDEAVFKYAKIGYKFKSLELGQTRLFLDWHEMNDFGALNETATSISFGVVQIVEPLGAELVLGYHNIDLDLAAGAASDDIDAVTAGIRLSF